MSVNKSVLKNIELFQSMEVNDKYSVLKDELIKAYTDRIIKTKKTVENLLKKLNISDEEIRQKTEKKTKKRTKKVKPVVEEPVIEEPVIEEPVVEVENWKERIIGSDDFSPNEIQVGDIIKTCKFYGDKNHYAYVTNVTNKMIFYKHIDSTYIRTFISDVTRYHREHRNDYLIREYHTIVYKVDRNNLCFYSSSTDRCIKNNRGNGSIALLKREYDTFY